METETSGGSDDQGVSTRIRSIVQDGREIRSNTADAVRQALGILTEVDKSISDVTSSVIESAVAAAATKLDEPTSGASLREVLDGVGDGLETAAQAVELTLSEARTSARSYAEEDLKRAATDLRAIGEQLLETAKRAAGKLEEKLGDGATDMVEHARHTAERVRPSLEAAAETALGDIPGMAKQTAGAGVAASREGIGTLLAEIGNRLRAGDGTSK